MNKFLGYYILWAFIHLVLLTMGWNGHRHDDFWPFSGSIEYAYDFSEFLVYVFGPIIVIIALYNIVDWDAKD
jgi:hypothetical protein